MRKEKLLIVIFVVLFGAMIFFISLKGPEEEVIIETETEMEEETVTDDEFVESDGELEMLMEEIRDIEEEFQAELDRIDEEIKEIEDSLEF